MVIREGEFPSQKFKDKNSTADHAKNLPDLDCVDGWVSHTPSSLVNTLKGDVDDGSHVRFAQIRALHSTSAVQVAAIPVHVQNDLVGSFDVWFPEGALFRCFKNAQEIGVRAILFCRKCLQEGPIASCSLRLGC